MAINPHTISRPDPGIAGQQSTLASLFTGGGIQVPSAPLLLTPGELPATKPYLFTAAGPVTEMDNIDGAGAAPTNFDLTVAADVSFLLTGIAIRMISSGTTFEPNGLLGGAAATTMTGSIFAEILNGAGAVQETLWTWDDDNAQLRGLALMHPDGVFDTMIGAADSNLLAILRYPSRGGIVIPEGYTMRVNLDADTRAGAWATLSSMTMEAIGLELT